MTGNDGGLAGSILSGMKGKFASAPVGSSLSGVDGGDSWDGRGRRMSGADSVLPGGVELTVARCFDDIEIALDEEATDVIRSSRDGEREQGHERSSSTVNEGQKGGDNEGRLGGATPRARRALDTNVDASSPAEIVEPLPSQTTPILAASSVSPDTPESTVTTADCTTGTADITGTTGTVGAAGAARAAGGRWNSIRKYTAAAVVVKRLAASDGSMFVDNAHTMMWADDGESSENDVSVCAMDAEAGETAEDNAEEGGERERGGRGGLAVVEDLAEGEKDEMGEQGEWIDDESY